MKKIIIMLTIMFVLFIPVANAQSITDDMTNQQKLSILTDLLNKYRVLVHQSIVDPNAPSCKQVRDMCIPYTDVYNGLAIQYNYYANLH